MGLRGFDSDQPTGRRGFFRQLMISAVEAAESVAREMAQRAAPRYSPPRYTPPPMPDYSKYLNPQYTTYGPPWPPPYGPYVDIELSRKLRSSRSEKSGGEPRPVAHDGPDEGSIRTTSATLRPNPSNAT